MSNQDNKNYTLERLEAVPGLDDKVNDVVFCTKKGNTLAGHVVFFGGDIQDYPENMLAHRDNKRHVQWNVENTARLLSDRFTDHQIWVVKPSKMYLKTFSVYSNFVVSSDIGNPEHSEGLGSWRHLASLLGNAMERCSLHSPEGATAQGSDGNHPITLVGFSKGCVVLNQLLYDLEQAKIDLGTSQFLVKVKDIYWLDGGHNGGSKVWLTAEDTLRHLVGTNIQIHSHVTPYQMKDPMRKWIGKEQKKFVKQLNKLGVNVTDVVHFGDEERSLDRHLRILMVF